MKILALSKGSETVVITGNTNSDTDVNSLTSDVRTSLYKGMIVTGAGIAADTIIASVESATEITLSRAATATATSVPLTFSKVNYDVPTNPHFVTVNGGNDTNVNISASRLLTLIQPDFEWNPASNVNTFTAMGGFNLNNCGYNAGTKVITTADDTDDLYIGCSIKRNEDVTDIPDDTVVTEILSGTTFRVSNIITTTQASGITLICGMEHSNLANTKGFRIKCFDDTLQRGVQLSGGDFNLATHYYFVLVYSDDYLQHHVAKITEFINEDVTGDAFEFEPKLGSEIPRDTKFQIWRLEIPTTNHPVAVSVGLKNTIEDNIVCASPLFYFFNDYLDKNNELNHNTRYNVKHDMCLAFSNAFTSADQTPILTSQDYSNSIIDYSKYSLKVKMVDNLRTLDNPTTNNGAGTCNEGLPLTAFNLDANNSCFPNSKRDATGLISAAHAAPQSSAAYRQITGPNRYLYYDFSPTKSNFTPNVFDAHIYESTGRRGSFAETKIADTFRMMPKKLKTFTPYRARHRLYQSGFNDWMALGAKVKANVTGNEYTFYTDFDLGTFFNVGDEVKVGSRILIVDTIDAFSSLQQDITFKTYNRINSESIFGTSSYTLSADDIIYRRAWNNTDGTLLTDFNFIDSRFTNLYVKFISSDFGLLEASVTAANKNTRLLTLSFDSQSYTSTTALDYLSGSYIIEVERFNGEIEKIDSYKEHGQTIMELSGRSNFSKLISPIINKNARFSQDIVYSSNSPFQKLISLGCYVYADFDSPIISFRTKHTTDASGGADEATHPQIDSADYFPVAGDKIFFKYDDGTICYAGEVLTYNISSDKKAELTQTSRASNHYYVGRPTAYYVPANTKNYIFNKALNSNMFIDSATSLTGASGKGAFFESGYKLTSSGAEDTALIGSSDINVAGAIGYYISDTNQIRNDYAFQTKLDNNASPKVYSSFDTINTLIDFTILKVSKEDNNTIVEIAPYLPLTLGRVDVNYANTQDTTFSTTTLGELLSYESNNSWAVVAVSDGSAALSSIASPRKYHGKPVYVGNVFQGFLRQAILQNDHTYIYIFLDRKWDGTSTGEVNVLEYTNGASTSTYSESSKLTHELNFLNGAHLHGGKIISLINPVVMNLTTGSSATATITVADGDAASGMTEKEYMTIQSTDGTELKYVIVDDNTTTVATGDILASDSDTGSSTAGSALVGGIAVAINLTGSLSTQTDFLIQLKAAIENVNGHGGKINVSDVPNVAATATITVADGDAASGMAENEKITIQSTDGTSKHYIIVDDQLSTVATGDVVTSGVTDVGSTTATASGVAVTIDLTGTPVTQNAFLVQLKEAIEHANGHNGKITVSDVPTQADGNQVITLTQIIGGTDGNNTITDDISQTTLAGFTGGLTAVDGAQSITLTQYTGGTAGNNAISDNISQTTLTGFTGAGIAAIGEITVIDGDAVTGMTEKEYINITSTDGTLRKYVLTDSNKGGVATGTVLASDSDTGAGTAGLDNVGGIAVAINISVSPDPESTQNDFLVQLRNAILHANGHNGKITISTSATDSNGDGVPDEANGNQTIQLTQNTGGHNGNTALPNTISQINVLTFSGGYTATQNKDRIGAFDYPMHYQETTYGITSAGPNKTIYTYSEKYGSPHYRILNLEKGQYNQTTHTNTGSSLKENKYYANITSKIPYYASAYRFKTGHTANTQAASGTTERTVIGVGKTGQTDFIGTPSNIRQVAEPHLLIESRGWKPVMGSRFFDTTIHYNDNSADPDVTGSQDGDSPETVLFTPDATLTTGTTASTASPYGAIDKFDLIDPKIARMFLFANSDLLPYSSTRYDSLMYSGQTRDISKYSLFSLIDPTPTTNSETKSMSFGGSTSTVTKDSSYASAKIIESDKTINSLKRFSMMRLTEIVFDWHYNQFDPENIPSKDSVLSKFDYKSYDFVATSCFSVLNDPEYYTSDPPTLTNVVTDPLAQFAVNDIVADSEGRYIGQIDSVSGSGPYTITFTAAPYKTNGNAYYYGRLYKATHADIVTNTNTISGHGAQDSFVVLNNDIHMLRSAVTMEGNHYGADPSSFFTKHTVELMPQNPHGSSRPNIYLPVAFSSPTSATGNLETPATPSNGDPLTAGFRTNHPSRVLKAIDIIQRSTEDDSTPDTNAATLASKTYQNLLPVFLDRFGIEDGGGSKVTKGTAAPSTLGACIRQLGPDLPSLVGINCQEDYSIYEGPSGKSRSYSKDADGVMMGFKLRIYNSGSALYTTKTAGNKTVYTYSMNAAAAGAWSTQLKHVNDLTGCYLVSEEITYGDGNTQSSVIAPPSINNGSPTTIAYIISHEVDTGYNAVTDNRHQIFVVDQIMPEGYYRVMQPNHTCFYDFSPQTISLNVMSSNYTKVSGESRTYNSDSISDYLIAEGTADKLVDKGPIPVNNQSGSEAVLSMYVMVDLDVQSSSTDTVVIRDQSHIDDILTNGTTYTMCVSDGENVNKTNIEYIVDSNPLATTENLKKYHRHLKFSSHKEMIGVPSISEIMNLTVNGEIPTNAKRAMIGSVISVCPEAEELIDELLEENDINYTLTKNTDYPLFLAPNYQGIDLFSAVNYLLEKKNKRLIDVGGSFTITDEDDSSHYSKIILNDNGEYQIYEYEKTSSMFDYYNEIVVYGRTHKTTRKDIKNIKLRGKKTLEVFENELLTQDEVDKRGFTLLKLHSDDNQKLTLTVGHKGISQIRTGDIIGVELLRENIPLRQYMVLQIEHLLTGNMKLELGRFSKQLEDRFAELALINQRTSTKLREQVFDENNISYDFLTDLNINEMRLLIRTTEVGADGFFLGFTTQLNTGTTTLGVGAGELVTILVEEEY